MNEENIKDKTILIIGGTEDARHLVRCLLSYDLKLIVTVTTEYGSELLLNENPNLTVMTGQCDLTCMTELLGREAVDLLLDASHPYAVNASKNAIDACKEKDIPYLRYERKEIPLALKGVHFAHTFKEAADMCNTYEGNILLAIGSNHLPLFCECVTNYKTRLFARILPTSQMVKRAEDCGLSAKQIIAVQGPFSKLLNEGLLLHVHAQVMVTKESGNVGGTLEKVEAALAQNIEVIVVKRPLIEYDEVYSDIETIISRIISILEV